MSRKTDYFNLLKEQMWYTKKAALKLDDVICNYDPEKLIKEKAELHIIERQADNKAHDIQALLSMEFITPIDRDDLVVLVQNIDDVVDAIDDVLIKAYIYDVKEMRTEALEFSSIIVSCAEALQDLAAELPNFRKSLSIKDLITKINLYEENADDLFVDTMARLFREKETSPLDVIVWMNMFEALELICDTFEDLAQVIERVIMKNT